MKLKYYLRGLGIGILVTTIIFIIGMKVNQDELMSDKEIMARAKELGMVMGENETKTLDELEKKEETEQEEKSKEEIKEEPKDQKQDEDVKADKQQEKEDSSTEPKTEKQSDESKKNQTEVVKQVEINIFPGEYSRTISQKLLDAGVIADQAEFNKFITENDYDNLIQPGTFNIPEGSSYEEIAKILTTKQENR